MKQLSYLLSLISIFVFNSCADNAGESITKATEKLYATIPTISKALGEKATTLSSVESVHNSVLQFVDLGLDEATPIEEILTQEENSKLQNSILKSVSGNSDSDATIDLEGIQIYWPYSEDWDQKSLPVITCKPSNGEYIDGDKVMAYSFSSVGGSIKIDSLLIDEEYAKKNPVWVIDNNGLNKKDIGNVKAGLATSEGVVYLPKTSIKSSMQKAASSDYKVAETNITKLLVTEQHDDWLNGGSEFDIYWFFPTSAFGLAQHRYRETFSRKDISKKRSRDLRLLANTDWAAGQEHNKIKIVETDSGSNKDVTISLTTSFTYTDTNKTESKSGSSETKISGEFKTNINIGRNDDDIMELVIARTAMLASIYKISSGVFNGLSLREE